jgi:hypothetical protein
MNITLTRRVALAYPSASAVQVVGQYAYIMGDDTPYLLQTDLEGNILAQHAVFSGYEGWPELARIPKPKKPDLEASALLPIGVAGSGPALMLFGSGARPERQRGFLVHLDEQGAFVEVEELPGLYALYEMLESEEDFISKGELNIEGAAYREGEIWLFNRNMSKGKHGVARLSASLLLELGRETIDDETPFELSFQHVKLKPLEDKHYAITGASTFLGGLVLTAATEDSEDAYEDGAVGGNAIGLLYFDPANLEEDELEPLWVKFRFSPEAALETKMEGIAYLGADGTALRFVGVTDDDKGGSEWLEIRIEP